MPRRKDVEFAKFNDALIIVALWISQGWADEWVSKWNSKFMPAKKLALYGRARAVVLFDRVLNCEVVQ